MTNAATARRLFRTIGTTDACTECQCCGRSDLKRTVVLVELDADGNDLEATYYGTSCAARAAGWTVKQTNTAARTADRERVEAEREAARVEQQRRTAERQARFCVWVRDTYGVTITRVSDLHSHRAVTGMTPGEVDERYSVETGDRA